MASGRLEAIAIRARPRAPMREVAGADVSIGAGIGGDARGKPGARQVTLLSMEAWRAACAEIGAELPWTLRRANLLVSGLDLASTRGRLVDIAGVSLEVTGETDPCRVMDLQHPGLRAALEPGWRGGVTCRVLAGGSISVGDAVELTGVGRQVASGGGE